METDYSKAVRTTKWGVAQGGGYNEYDILTCPYCNEKYEHVEITKYKYCPNCGKSMHK